MERASPAPAWLAGTNPYAAVHDRQRRRRGRRGAVVLPLVAAALATPLARPVLLRFLDGGSLVDGVQGFGFRLGALVAAVALLQGFTDLVRGEDRPVLDAHPVRADLVVAAIARRGLRERAWLPAAAAILASPVALAGHPAAWAGLVALAAGAFVAAVGVGQAVVLGGILAALSPRMARLMDAIRGDNPRMHAAFIYAPGAGMAVVGLALGLAASALGWALGGWAPGWAFLALPPLLGLAGARLARRLAPAAWLRATALVTEIDGMYAGVESPDEARRVYLDWLAGDRPELLRALRHGWRGLRSWATGAWLLGLGGALAGWSDDPAAAGRVIAVSGASTLLLGLLPSRMAAGDPAWLDAALGVRPAAVAGARATATFLYAQAAVIPPVMALLVRQGAAALPPLLAGEALAAVGAGFGALAAMRWRERGAWAYGPAALVVWAAVTGGLA